tara:strand:- start:65 stop:490 length:426 start_codon:yes stop_codon:yes gene_type:complete
MHGGIIIPIVGSNSFFKTHIIEADRKNKINISILHDNILKTILWSVNKGINKKVNKNCNGTMSDNPDDKMKAGPKKKTNAKNKMSESFHARIKLEINDVTKVNDVTNKMNGIIIMAHRIFEKSVLNRCLSSLLKYRRIFLI